MILLLKCWNNEITFSIKFTDVVWNVKLLILLSKVIVIINVLYKMSLIGEKNYL